jgi:ribosome-binding factor A
VTGVQTARNLRNATVSISIFGHEQERGAYLRIIANKARELQSLINRDLTLKYTPRLRFVLDGSVEKGDHILDVLSKLDVPQDPSGGQGQE